MLGLKHLPRAIALGSLLLFSIPLGLVQLNYMVSSSSIADSSDATSLFRLKLRTKIESLTSIFTWLERVDYDVHLRSHDPGPPHHDVAVVEMGEESIQKLGQFPFSRTIYKALLEKLEAAGARVVAFDATFPEKDARNETIVQLRQLRHEIEQVEGFDSRAVREIDQKIFSLDADEDFATALHKAKIPIVLGFTFASSRDFREQPGNGEFFQRYDIFRRQVGDVTMLSSQSGNIPVISIGELVRSLNEKGSIGHFNPDVDPDSTIRRVPAVIEYGGRIMGALSLRALAGYYGEEPVLDGTDGLAVRGVTRSPEGLMIPGKMHVPLNPWGGLLVRYYGGNRVFPYTEFSDVVQGKLSETELKDRFAGRIVFIGVTAVGLKDLRATPFSAEYPGVEVHATVASNVLSQHFMVRDSRFFLYGLLFIWIVGGAVAAAVFRLQPMHSFALTALAVFATQTVAHFLFFNRGVVVPTVLPSLACIFVFMAGVLYRYFSEEKEKKMVRASFSRYVSGAVVEEILKDQSKLRLGGQKRELKVMFVDLVGFTRQAEGRDVAFVTTLLNDYFTRMTRILLKNQGTLDKYMGDGLMCFWGAPLEIEKHAALACLTAIEMREELARINREWKEKHDISIENRIGVHTGEMAVGNMGSDQVFSYTVIGDNVNLGSRIEGVNTAYGTHVLVSKHTAEKAGKEFLFRPLDRVQVKGREEAVELLELVGRADGSEPEWIHAFSKGLEHYRAAEWDDAASAFGACLALKPGDGPSQIFLDRIAECRKHPPKDWNGVWRLTSK